MHSHLDPRIESTLNQLISRQRWTRFGWLMALVWIVIGGCAILVPAMVRLREESTWSYWLTVGCAACVMILVVFAVIFCRRKNLASVCQAVEHRHPKLDQRLMTLLETRHNTHPVFAKQLTDEVVYHSRVHEWGTVAKRRWCLLAWVVQFATLIAVCYGITTFDHDYFRSDGVANQLQGARELVIEPGDIEIERYTDLLVTARFPESTNGRQTTPAALSGKLPSEVLLEIRHSVNRDVQPTDDNTPGSNTPGSNTPGSNTPGSNTLGRNTRYGNANEGNTVKSNTVKSNTVKSNTVESNTIESHRESHSALPMQQALRDLLFSGIVTNVASDIAYRVRTDDGVSRWYEVTVFTLPELMRSDVLVRSPEYSERPEKFVADTRRVTTLPESSVEWYLHLNKPVASAKFFPVASSRDDSNSEIGLDAEDILEATPLSPDQLDTLASASDESSDRAHSSTYVIRLLAQESQVWELQLIDLDGRMSRSTVQFSMRVLPNLPPELVLDQRSDRSVSPLEEIVLSAKATDDVGVQRMGVSYAVGGQEPVEIELLKHQEREAAVEHLIALEQLSAEPGELVSHYFWAEDFDSLGNLRRTASDMFFSEVRPFEQIFRQSDQTQSPSQSEQQQSSGMPQAEQLAEQQKQIIIATWNVIRDYQANGKYVNADREAVEILSESQRAVRESAQEDFAEIEDQKLKVIAEQTLESMSAAVTSLDESLQTVLERREDVAELQAALRSEQASYQGLLKLRPDESNIFQSNSQSPSQSSASGRNLQRQIDQLQLDQNQNRYEQESQAAGDANDPEREARQVLNRLKELARRQEDINEQIREAMAALEAAETEDERKEIEEQLQRLRDAQEDLLRDADELIERMDENPSQSQEAQSQMQQARDNAQQSLENLNQSNPSNALASGSRAEEQLNSLSDELQKQSSDAFQESIQELVDQARQLEEQQASLIEQFRKNLDPTPAESNATPESPEESPDTPGLRGGPSVDKLQEQLQNQRERVEQLKQELQQATLDAEESQPLLADELYRSFRELEKERVSEQLGQAEMFLDRSLTEPAADRVAAIGETFETLRERIEDAARDIIDDETQQLRRALRELEEAEAQIESELVRNAPNDAEGSTQTDETDPRPTGADDGEAQQSSDNARTNENPERQGDSRPTGANSTESDSSQRSSDPSGLRPGNARQTDTDASTQNRMNGSSLDRFAPQPTRNEGGNLSNGTDRDSAPLTGEDFLEFSDRLRDVEELLTDSELRDRAREIREIAQDMRQDFKRTRQAPQWDLVRRLIANPLAELRKAASSDLIRKTADQNSLVPIDRDNVPRAYQDANDRYFETLGAETQSP